MPDVMFTGPEGRLEGRYHQSKEEHAPIALILHPHPQYGGTMNHKVVFSLFHVFVNRGFSVLRFNTRGVGRSQGRFDNGMGELSDAAAALDWLQSMNADAKSCWIAGYSFGAWIGMQLLMRRPDLVAAQIEIYASAKRADAARKDLLPSIRLTGGGSTWRIYAPDSRREEKVALGWNSFATPIALDEHTYGYRWHDGRAYHGRRFFTLEEARKHFDAIN